MYDGNGWGRHGILHTRRLCVLAAEEARPAPTAGRHLLLETAVEDGLGTLPAPVYSILRGSIR